MVITVKIKYMKIWLNFHIYCMQKEHCSCVRQRRSKEVPEMSKSPKYEAPAALTSIFKALD